MALSGGARVDAEQALDDAVKALNKLRVFGKDKKYEEAAAFYGKAGALFKTAKMWQEAGDAFVKAAENYIQANNPEEAYAAFLSAGKAFKNGGFKKDALKAYESVVLKYMANNKFSMAGKIYKEMAEMEEEEKQIDLAMELYNKAADCHLAEEQLSTAQSLLLKVADLAAGQGDYKKAAALFEQCATMVRKSAAQTFNAVEYYLSAGICHLGQGLKDKDHGEGLRAALSKYKEDGAQVEKSRELIFLSKLADAFDEEDADEFVEVIYHYDRLSPIKGWRLNVLLACKQQLLNPEDNAPDLA